MSTLRPAPGWDNEALRRGIDGYTWFHTIDLGGGVRTPGADDTLNKLAHLHLPEDLSGASVLDIGTYDGFFAFECEHRNARRVMATDQWSWQWPGSNARRNFDWLRAVLASRVEDRVVSVPDLTAEAVEGPYDLVLFLGVLYHAPDPLGYLRRVRTVTSGTVVVETVVDLLDVDVPAAAYYPGASLNGDASNHWGPNPAAVEGLLHDAGFASVVRFEPWSHNPTWALHLDDNRPRSLRRRIAERLVPRTRSGRMVFHASVT